jgi:tetratricopeptide (TPR) repeat protein
MGIGDESEGRAVEGEGASQRVSAVAGRRVRWFLFVAVMLGAGLMVCLFASFSGLLRQGRQTPPDGPGWSDPSGPPDSSGRSSGQPASGPQAEMRALREEALDVARRVDDDLPDVPDALCMMGLVHHRYGNRAQAEKSWNRCLQLNPRYGMAYYCLGQSALERGQYEEAIRLSAEAIAIDPQMADAHLLSAKAMMGLGRMGEAISSLQDYISLNRGSAEGHFRLGQAYLHSGQYEEAKQCHIVAIEIDPNWAAAYHALGTVCARLGQKEEAQQYREEFEKRKKEDPRVQGLRARVHDDLASLRQGVADAYLAAGQVYSAHGSPEKAEKHWLRAAEAYPEDTACRKALISMYEQKNRLADAVRVLGELAELEPENAIHYMNLGVLNTRLKRFDSAEEAFRKLQDVAPDRPEGYRALAELYLGTDQRISEAKALAGKAVQLHPVASNYYLLGMACLRDGDQAGALNAFERAKDLDPGDVRYREAYAEIQQRLRAGSKDETK